MNMYSFKLTPEQADRLQNVLREGNYIPRAVPYTSIAVEAPQFPCNVSLYTSKKCVIQGKGAQEFMEMVFEPQVLKQMVMQNDGSGKLIPTELSAEALSPHIGVDESGKGDFFGPLVIAAAYVDEPVARALQKLGVQDSKAISSDKEIRKIADSIRSTLGPQRYSVIKIGPEAYNRGYAKIRSLNRMLAWGHAKTIENVRKLQPSCPMAISDQFGTEDTVRNELQKIGCSIELRSRTRAESDIAVAAASILARDVFVQAIGELEKKFSVTFPKGASNPAIHEVGKKIASNSPESLLQCAKCHFRITDEILLSLGLTRLEMPPEGQVLSQPKKSSYKK